MHTQINLRHLFPNCRNKLRPYLASLERLLNFIAATHCDNWFPNKFLLKESFAIPFFFGEIMRFINVKLISFFIKKFSQLSEHKLHTLNTKSKSIAYFIINFKYPKFSGSLAIARPHDCRHVLHVHRNCFLHWPDFQSVQLVHFWK